MDMAAVLLHGGTGQLVPIDHDDPTSPGRPTAGTESLGGLARVWGDRHRIAIISSYSDHCPNFGGWVENTM